MADNLTTFMCRWSWNLGASTSWNPKGLSRPVMGLMSGDGFWLQEHRNNIWLKTTYSDLQKSLSLPRTSSWVSTSTRGRSIYIKHHYKHMIPEVLTLAEDGGSTQRHNTDQQNPHVSRRATTTRTDMAPPTPHHTTPQANPQSRSIW
jgi:hypothetical protein